VFRKTLTCILYFFVILVLDLSLDATGGTIILTDTIAIEETEAWIKEVVVGCNFCPFAAKALIKKTIRFSVLTSACLENSLDAVLKELKHLDRAEDIETTFIIFPNDFESFTDYLHLVDKAEQLLLKHGYEGIYQLASFHPRYCFADASDDDPANYTNRSIFPMLHLLREESITRALENFPDPETIQKSNIEFARQKGLKYMQLLRAACMDV